MIRKWKWSLLAVTTQVLLMGLKQSGATFEGPPKKDWYPSYGF